MKESAVRQSELECLGVLGADVDETVVARPRLGLEVLTTVNVELALLRGHPAAPEVESLRGSRGRHRHEDGDRVGHAHAAWKLGEDREDVDVVRNVAQSISAIDEIEAHVAGRSTYHNRTVDRVAHRQEHRRGDVFSADAPA